MYDVIPKVNVQVRISAVILASVLFLPQCLTAEAQIKTPDLPGNISGSLGDDPMTADKVLLHLESMETKNEKVAYIQHEAEKFADNGKLKEARIILDHAINKLEAKSVEVMDLAEDVRSRIEDQKMEKINPQNVTF